MSAISRTVFTFTVLHRTDEPFDQANEDGPFANELGEAMQRSWDGNAVGLITHQHTVRVSDTDVPELLQELGNDGTFFDDGD